MHVDVSLAQQRTEELKLEENHPCLLHPTPFYETKCTTHFFHVIRKVTNDISKGEESRWQQGNFGIVFFGSNHHIQSLQRAGAGGSF